MAVTVRAEGKWQVERLGVRECLLHPVADSVLVVLGLDNCDRQALLPEQQVVSSLTFTTGSNLATDKTCASVKENSRRTYRCQSHLARSMAGVMYRMQISVSFNPFLFTRR